MPPNQQNPYDFITSSTPKKRGISFGGSSQKARLLQVGLFGGILVIVAIIFFAVIGNVGKGDTNTLLALAAEQQDIIAITADGGTNIRNSALAIQNATTAAVITSHNNETLKLIAAAGNKKPTKAISALQVTTYKKSLDDAKKNGNYDEVFTALLANRIDSYRVKLQAAYASAKSSATKKQLSGYYQQLEVFTPQTATTN